MNEWLDDIFLNAKQKKHICHLYLHVSYTRHIPLHYHCAQRLVCSVQHVFLQEMRLKV